MEIAQLTLRLMSHDGVRTIAVKLHAPEATLHGDWACDYEIGWPEGQRRFQGCGLDSMQALVHALQMIGAELYASQAHKEGRLSMDEHGPGYGIPVSPILRDLLTARDAKSV